MKTVDDIQAFSTLVKKIKKRGNEILSNCYLMPEDVIEYTHDRNMFWEELNNGIIFLCEERDFYYLYFYLSQYDEQVVNIHTEDSQKPIVIDLVCLDKNKQSQLYNIENFWRRNGFKLNDTYSRMVLSSPPLIEQENDIKPEYKLGHASSDHLREIDYMWRSSLNLYSTALPREEKLVKLLNEGQVLAIFDQYDNVVAVMLVLNKGKVGVIKHVVVLEEFRNQGLAKFLLHASFSHYNRTEKWYLWVSDNNTPAKMFYIKSGFAFDGIISRQLLQT